MIYRRGTAQRLYRWSIARPVADPRRTLSITYQLHSLLITQGKLLNRIEFGGYSYDHR